MSKAGKKRADIEALMATYSEHVSANYPGPARFRDNLARMLAAKKEQLSPEAYVDSLESNLVFLVDLVTEGEAYLELVLGRVNDGGLTSAEIAGTIEEMEGRVRASTARRREELLDPQAGGELAGLTALREGGGGEYVEKLEFNYIYYMAMRLLLFEFFNVLAAVREEYTVQRVDEAAFDHVRIHVEMTVNYLLGNISVGEIVPETGPS
jgi:hypothetical protein